MNIKLIHTVRFLIALTVLPIIASGCSGEQITATPTPTYVALPTSTPTPTLEVVSVEQADSNALDMEMMEALLTREDLEPFISRPVSEAEVLDLRGTLPLSLDMQSRFGTRFVADDQSSVILLSVVDFVTDQKALDHFRTLAITAINNDVNFEVVIPVIGGGALLQKTNPITLIVIEKDKIIELSTLIYPELGPPVLDFDGLKELGMLIADRL